MRRLLHQQKKDMEEINAEEQEGQTTYSGGALQFKKELPELSVIPQCKLKDQTKTDIMNFKAEYKPDEESLWYGGTYEFSISIPDSYPFNAPKVMCLTKIYHPNIDYNGNVCLNILKEDWKPTLSVSTVIAGIYFLFTDPNPEDPLNHEAAEVMRDNPDTFVANVKKTLKGGLHFKQEFKKFI